MELGKRMKVTIRGNNPVTSEQVKNVIDNLNEEFGKQGLKVKNLTCYIRFVTEDGKTVEPTKNGYEIEKTITITQVKEITTA